MYRTFAQWGRPMLLYALVLIFLFWTVAPVAWIAIMSVQPEINYVTVPPQLRLGDTSLRWYRETLGNAS